ncbi:MAG: SpoIVB peptidase [Lachnospiraceae bacterium]|nr:SpoIVB peptidase [Lachnospiraceae bacterium]
MRVNKHKKRGKICCRFFILSLVLLGLTLTGAWIFELWNRVPSAIRVRAGQEEGLSFYLPATATIYKEDEGMLLNVDLNRQLTFYGEKEGNYTMEVQLFGLIPFKEASLSVIRDTRLTPAGTPIGIYVHTRGVLVVDTGEFEDENGKEVAPAEGVLKGGDYIETINGEVLEDKGQLMEMVADSEGKTLSLEIERDGEEMSLDIFPRKNQQGEYKLGIWVRDNAQGIGTMTFVDENGYFGALGHGINDLDTAQLMELKAGGLYKTEIVAVNKGTAGDPGELSGVIAYAEKNKLGEILQNSHRGIYGKVDTENIHLEEEAMPIALKQEIKEGPAQILCTLEDSPVYYEIEILKVNEENSQINRGLEIRVTDEELLEKTGGIIQGMSGSPIIQDGKLIGAVTHVMVNDPARGYGIFIEEMLGYN